MSAVNLAVGAATLAIASFFIWGGIGLGVGTVASPASGFLPFWEGVFLALASVVLTVGSVRQSAQKVIEWPRADARRRTIHLTAALAGYLLLVELLGYTLSTCLFMVVGIRAWKAYSWKVAAVSAAVFSGLLFLVFTGLNSPLPRNPLGLP